MKRLIQLTTLTFTLALVGAGCGDDSGTKTPQSDGSAQSDGSSSTTCQSAGYSALLGSCTAMGQCFEEYAPSASAELIAAGGSGCSTAGGTWAATTACATTGVLCKCEETGGGMRMVNFYTIQSLCDECTGSCKKILE